MLSIKAQRSVRNGVSYYREHLSHDDYYSERQQTAGRWFGRCCQAVGVDSQAPVKEEDFAALCKGVRPDTGAKLTQRVSASRRCLYDCTLSAPKSLSIMALVAGDERLLAAHEQAVSAALEAAERLAAVRVRRGQAVDTRQARVTGNLVGARFTHRESRALDPQLHTHAIVFNVTHDPLENRLKALEARPLYDQARNLTRLYRQHLSQSLHALGYDTYRDEHYCVQIRGVSAELMARFSKRSAQRDTLVALRERELGRSLSKGEVSRLIHEHRTKKQRRIDPEALRRAQLAQLTPADRVQLEQLKAQALAGPRPPMARPFVPRLPGFGLGPESGWVAGLRLALLVSRALDLNPYMFSPTVSFPQRVYNAARFMRQVQRTTSVLRYAQRSRQLSLSR